MTAEPPPKSLDAMPQEPHWDARTTRRPGAPPPTAADAARTLRSIRRRAFIVVGLLAAYAALSAMLFVQEIRVQLYVDAVKRTGDADFFQAEALDSGTLSLAVMILPALIVTGVAFILWLRAVIGVAERFKGAHLDYGRTWAIFAWFIPLANYVLPYLTVRGALRAVGDGTERAASRLLLSWWVAWIAMNAISFAAAVAIQLDGAGLALSAASWVFELAAAALAIGVVRAVEARAEAAVDSSRAPATVVGGEPSIDEAPAPDLSRRDISEPTPPRRRWLLATILTGSLAMLLAGGSAAILIPAAQATTNSTASVLTKAPAYGLSFEHPAWFREQPTSVRTDGFTEIFVASDARGTGAHGLLGLMVIDAPSSLSLDDIAAQFATQVKGPIGHGTIGGLPALHVRFEGDPTQQADDAWVTLRNGRMFMLVLTALPADLDQYSPYFDRIARSVAFAN